MSKISSGVRLRKLNSNDYKTEITTKLFNELRGSAFQRYEKCQKQVLSEAFRRGYEKGFVDGLQYKEIEYNE